MAYTPATQQMKIRGKQYTILVYPKSKQREVESSLSTGVRAYDVKRKRYYIIKRRRRRGGGRSKTEPASKQETELAPKAKEQARPSSKVPKGLREVARFKESGYRVYSDKNRGLYARVEAPEIQELGRKAFEAEREFREVEAFRIAKAKERAVHKAKLEAFGAYGLAGRQLAAKELAGWESKSFKGKVKSYVRASGYRVAGDFLQAVHTPKKYAKDVVVGTYQTFRHPLKTMDVIGEEFKRGGGVSLVSQAILLGELSRAGGRVVKPAVRRVVPKINFERTARAPEPLVEVTVRRPASEAPITVRKPVELIEFSPERTARVKEGVGVSGQTAFTRFKVTKEVPVGIKKSYFGGRVKVVKEFTSEPVKKFGVDFLRGRRGELLLESVKKRKVKPAVEGLDFGLYKPSKVSKSLRLPKPKLGFGWSGVVGFGLAAGRVSRSSTVLGFRKKQFFGGLQSPRSFNVPVMSRSPILGSRSESSSNTAQRRTPAFSFDKALVPALAVGTATVAVSKFKGGGGFKTRPYEGLKFKTPAVPKFKFDFGGGGFAWGSGRRKRYKPGFAGVALGKGLNLRSAKLISGFEIRI